MKLGEPAPDFEVRLPDGGRVSLRDHRGRPLVLVFLRHLA
jgi:peroxiredoxin